SHCGSAGFRVPLSLCPEQCDGVVWGVVLEHKWESATSVSQIYSPHSAHSRVLGLDDRIVVVVGQGDERAIPSGRGEWKILGKNHAEGHRRIAPPQMRKVLS